MPVTDTTEKRFESDIEAIFLSAAGGYTKCQDEYDPKLGLYKDTLIRFIKDSQPKAWQRFCIVKHSGTRKRGTDDPPLSYGRSGRI